jgi:hypothetical protein
MVVLGIVPRGSLMNSLNVSWVQVMPELLRPSL